VISPLAVNDTDVCPVSDPASCNVPALAVSSKVCAVMGLVLFRLLAATKLKSVPADDEPETFTLPVSLILTKPAALALRLETFVVRGTLAEPMLPAVEVIFNVGVFRELEVEFVMLPLEVSDTDELPFTAPPRLRDPAVALNSTV